MLSISMNIYKIIIYNFHLKILIIFSKQIIYCSCLLDTFIYLLGIMLLVIFSQMMGVTFQTASCVQHCLGYFHNSAAA